VPPEQLLEATVLLALYSIRSERAFCERLNYDLLFKWFLDLPIDAAKSFAMRVSSLVSPTQPVPSADPLARRVTAQSTR
jgi:transposase